MEAISPIDFELRAQSEARRAAALDLITKTKPLSLVAMQIPIWFALLLVVFMAAVSFRTHINPGPYIAIVLVPVIGYVAGCQFRMQRRVEALVQLIVHNPQ